MRNCWSLDVDTMRLQMLRFVLQDQVEAVPMLPEQQYAAANLHVTTFFHVASTAFFDLANPTA